MFGISFEHILIVGIILVVLGPKRLPEMGNSVGKAIKNFKDSFGNLHEEAEKLQAKTLEKPKSQTPPPQLASTPVTESRLPTELPPTDQLSTADLAMIEAESGKKKIE